MMTTKTEWSPLAEALAVIAGQCDGAREDDGRGFNAGDVPLGHYLASVPAALWDETAATAAHQLARIYRAQLASAGIEFEDLPVPEEPEAQVREELTERRRAAKQAQKITSNSFCETGTENGAPVIVLGFPYDPDMVSAAREIPGRSYRPVFGSRTKVNVYPASSASVVIDFAREHHIPVTVEVEALAADPPAAPKPEPLGPNVTFRTRESLAIRFDGFPGAGVLDAVKSIPGRRWDAPSRTWTVPISSLPELAAVAKDTGLRLAEDVTAALEQAAGREAYNLRASIALGPEHGGIEVPGLAGTLKPHQQAGLEYIAANRRVLVGDKMGLGKTLLSLAACAACAAWPAVIVCKTSLRINWQREAEQFFPGTAVFIASGNAPVPVPAGTRIIVIGFDVLKESYTATVNGAKRKRAGWAKALIKLAPKALIVDESHFGKEASAARSQAMELLGCDVAARDGIVLCLSGTAIVNRPKELLQQLKILGRLEELGGEWPFKYRYCDPQPSEWGTTFDGATNLTELHERLRATGIYLRRGDSALNLPALTIRPVWIGEEEIDPEAMAAYRRAEHDFLTELMRQAEARGVDLSDPVARDAFCRKAASAETLVRLNLLRQLVGDVKTAAVTTAVEDLVGRGEKVMVAAHHRPIVEHYAKRFTGLRIQGGQSTEAVEADKAAFQTLPVADAPVIAVSTQAGGVGHTLTAAANGVMAEIPWTWAEIEQMAARLHRIGQTRPVDFPVMLATDTVDGYMWQVVSAKRSITAAVLDGATPEAASEHAVAAEVMALMLAARSGA